MTASTKDSVMNLALRAYLNVKAMMSDAPEATRRQLAFGIWRWLRIAGVDVPKPSGDPQAWLQKHEGAWWGLVPKGRPEFFAAVCAHLLARFSKTRLLEFIQESGIAENNRLLAGQLIYEAVFHGGLSPAEADLVIDGFDKSPEPELISASKQKVPAQVLTRCQRSVIARCSSLAELYFSRAHQHSILRPRVFPLIAGPTGAGKSKLAKILAEQVGAKHLMVSFARWMPQGVGKEYEPTQFSILREATLNKRLIVQIDEIDKFGEMNGSSTGSWTKSVVQEIFAVLDGEWAMDAFRRHASIDAKDPNPPTDCIFFMGSGTWQSIHANPPKSMGFSSGKLPGVDSTADRIRAAQTIPQELMARFHHELLLLSYPSPDEIPELLESYGLNALAARAGETIDPKAVDFNRSGMRIFEGMASDLLLKIQDKKNERTMYAG